MAIGAPNNTPGALVITDEILACDPNSKVFVDLSNLNDWHWQSYQFDSDITMDGQIQYPVPADGPDIYVKSTNTNATGTRNVTANFIYEDAIGVTCGLKSVVKPVTLQGPLDRYNIGLNVQSTSTTTGSMCADEINILSATYVGGTVDLWEWNLPSGWTVENGYAPNQKRVIYPTFGQTIQIRATNACGTTDWKSFYVPVDDCSGGPIEMIAIAPNPVTEETTSIVPDASISAEDVELLVGETFLVNIFQDINLVFTKKNVHVNEELDLSTLQPGNHIMHIIDHKGNLATKHLLIE